MDRLDLILILVCLAFAVSGYRQGLIVGALSFAGFLGGGAIGAHFAPSLHHHLHVSIAPTIFGLLCVIVAAMLGQVVAATVGLVLRRRLGWHPLQLLDSVGGAALSVVSVLLVAWFIGTAVAHTAVAGVSRQVRDSTVLQAVDGVVPGAARTWFASFRRLLDDQAFPQVFGAIAPPHIVKVRPPNPALARSRAVATARPDVVKITGNASCSRGIEGSGFVYATDRIMTNAHVVAGVTAPTVHLNDGRSLRATVVFYDPDRDIAVLAVPGLGLPPLQFDGVMSRGDDGVVVGYPENGPFRPSAARVRSVQNARGPNIYQSREVTRQIYSLYAVVRPGNSGGPLLTRQGRVAGVVFATSVDDPRTGYALTLAEVAGDARAGTASSGAVSTGGCD